METCCDMRGFLTFIVLRLLSKKQLSGEELREELRKRKGSRPSSGTIYPCLKILHENGFIEETERSGKIKRYKLTKKGESELKRATRQFVKIFYDMKEEYK